jgi:hypothetical protein
LPKSEGQIIFNAADGVQMKLFKAFATFSLLIVAFQSKAQENPYQAKRIYAEFRCTLPDDTQFSFNLKPGKERVWMSIARSNMGIPLQILQVSTGPCLGCYKIQALLDNGLFTFTISSGTPARAKHFKVKMEGSSVNGKVLSDEDEGTCKNEKKKY